MADHTYMSSSLAQICPDLPNLYKTYSKIGGSIHIQVTTQNVKLTLSMGGFEKESFDVTLYRHVYFFEK